MIQTQRVIEAVQARTEAAHSRSATANATAKTRALAGELARVKALLLTSQADAAAQKCRADYNDKAATRLVGEVHLHAARHAGWRTIADTLRKMLEGEGV